MTTCAFGLPFTNMGMFNLDVATPFQGYNVSDQQILSMGPYTSGVLVDLATTLNLPSRTEIDALMISGDSIYFSLSQDVFAGGVAYADEDILVHVAGTSEMNMFLDGSAIGLPLGADLDAACFEGGTTSLLFSVQKTIVLPDVGRVTDDDVIRWRQGAFSIMAQGGDDLLIPEDADIDAMHMEGDTLFFSLDIGATIQGESGADHDVWSYSVLSNTVSLEEHMALVERVDLVSMNMRSDLDGDGLSDYEELSGYDDPGTALASGTRLDPEGHTSDPLLLDTDNDGADDAQEAFMGTDPTDKDSQLHMVFVSPSSASDLITWASVPDRIYRLEFLELDQVLREFSILSTFTNLKASGGTTTSITNVTPGGVLHGVYTYRVSVTGLEPQ